eukprot:CAMPEP_0180385164 /NCGR_PEP_ID=MMETSP0989-20121125/28959_1 /TAXON_ID=697907 /ORGANISM="non described non described, Strain CCMP2293" /LENGTH=44 /DNA_ID= /DNA_START= /DNA_END= /DNA_ORIENTATION=
MNGFSSVASGTQPPGKGLSPYDIAETAYAASPPKSEENVASGVE